jgi:putative flippase GtrA
VVQTLLVVPCYNEVGRFQASAFDEYLAAGADVGFVLVNDGSTDNTLDALRDVERRWSARVQVLDLQPNQGKGEAVRLGMLRAMQTAKYVGYFDADLATPLDAIAEFVDVLEQHSNIDIVLGARVALLGRQIHRHARRHYLGRVFATAASLVLALPVYDTQCGAKLFRVRNPMLQQLLDRPFGSRWIFDVELLARYLTTSGARDGLYELPLQRWTDVGESHVKPRDFLRAGGEMAAIYRNYGLRRDFALMLAFVSAPFVRYAGAGGAGTAVHYGTLTVVVELVGASPTVGTGIGALAGACVNYILNYHLTFASNMPHRRTAPRFFAIAALAAALSTAGMWFAVHRFHMHYLLAQLVCTFLVLVMGYALNRLWTFRSSRQPIQSPLPVVDLPQPKQSPALRTPES